MLKERGVDSDFYFDVSSYLSDLISVTSLGIL